MDFNPGKYYNILESLVSIFTIDQGQVKVLLLRKKSEPYRGYWILPGGIVSNDETIEMNIIDSIEVKLGLKDVYLEQCHIFSNLDRDPDDRIIAISYIGLIDNVSALFKREDRDDIQTAWFKINDVPKMAYDHARILKKNIEFLRRKIVNSNVLKSLFPSDFTLPELQKAYEQILNVTMDRRNFRKKMLSLNLIDDTGDTAKFEGKKPAKQYRFKNEIESKKIF